MAQIVAQKTGVEIPFDLNKIFSLTYEFQPLKEVLEHIYGQLKKNSDDTHKVDTKLVSKMLLLDKLKNENEEFKKELITIKNVNKELEQKSCAHDADLSSLKSDTEACKMNISLINRQIGSLPGRMSDAEDRLDELSKRLEGGLDSSDYLKRLEKVEDQSGKNNKIITEWHPHWIQMLKDIENLKKNMVTADIFDAEMENLRNLINQLAGKEIQVPNSSGANISQKELADIKEAIKKVWEHEEKLKGIDLYGLMKKVEKIQEELKLKADKSDILRLDFDKADKSYVDGEFKKIYKDLEMLKDWCAKLEEYMANTGKGSSTITDAQFAMLVKRVERLEERLMTLQKQQTMQSSAGFAETRESIGDENVFKDLNSRLNAMQAEIDHLKNEFAKWVKEFQDSLNGKADLEALANLERILQDRISEVVKGLTKQLADKNDTKKALKLLERQLKNLYDLFMSRGGHNENEDDAMFTKKPLGGMSCASCEKDIINLQGRKADYLPWGKFPFRDPSERIARVGQGFSKMLSMINPDTLSRFDNNGRFNSIHAGHHAQNHLSQKGSQENFYNHNEEMDDHVPASTFPQPKPGTAGKTMNNFYHAQQMQDMNKRPGSAQVVPKPRVKNNFNKSGAKK